MKPKAPKHLSAAIRKWWWEVAGIYDLEPHHVKILVAACEAWDRAEQAREALREHGLTYNDRFGQPRARPEAAMERDNSALFARLVRQLGLDIDAPGPVGRPLGR